MIPHDSRRQTPVTLATRRNYRSFALAAKMTGMFDKRISAAVSRRFCEGNLVLCSMGDAGRWLVGGWMLAAVICCLPTRMDCAWWVGDHVMVPIGDQATAQEIPDQRDPAKPAGKPARNPAGKPEKSGGNKPAPGLLDDDKAIAVYADAANFQTGGAIDLAIDQWQKFLDDYPQHSLAAKAAHYLGVCYMQREEPDYQQAAKAFHQALKNKQYDLREESLANQGWCLLAWAGSGEDADPGKLRAVLQIYQTLQDEFPQTRFIDRALFYSGEAAYGLKQADRAVGYYSQLLALPSAKDSPLRCDALYARGVALEESKKIDQAMASFKQLLESCADKNLITDVYLRLGDLRILAKEFDAAVETFELAIGASESNEDKAYAIFRQAYALVQSGKPKLASEKYEQLANQFPDSPYRSSAILASAQSLYRGGDNERAAERFTEVIARGDTVSATEASHWLARIAIAGGDLARAIKVARTQIDRGIGGEYAIDLKMDLAETLSLDPATVAESIDRFEQAYRDDPQDDLAPRALYNAAFSALQVGELDRATQLANEFIGRFPDDDLLPDVQFVSAESSLGRGAASTAADQYAELLAKTKPDNLQRSAWVLRGGAAMIAARDFGRAVELLTNELAGIKQPDQRLETYLLIGQAHMAAGNSDQAAQSFDLAYKQNPQGARAEEARLLRGKVLAATHPELASEIWQQIIDANPGSSIAEQSRYKLGELAASRDDHSAAITFYEQVLDSDQDPGLKPYAKYGVGFSQMQLGEFQEAATTLNSLIDDYPDHPIKSEAMLSRGITNRHLKNYEAARGDLETYLANRPSGENLGHALYELALIDSQQSQFGEAVNRLRQIISEVPDYPAMEKVVYELGWAMQENGDRDAAAEQFASLARRFPQSSEAAEAAYYLGQRFYVDGQYDQAADQFIAASKNGNASLKEKSIYRAGWAYFKAGDFKSAQQAFRDQLQAFPDGELAFDGQLMVGESLFKQRNYAAALQAYRLVRQQIQSSDDTAQTVREPAQRQARELALLHGGQSAAQTDQWNQALQWYDELRVRFPATEYIEQVFFETGFAYQQIGDEDKALKFFDEVATNFRDELAARARFMMGEIHFAAKRFDQAIPQFQRVMFGFGAGQAPDAVKNWQAKSGFEAARCSEVLWQQAKTETARSKAAEIARGFYTYVTDKHPNHELAEKAQARLGVLGKKQ